MAAKIYNPTHTPAYCASYDPESIDCQKCECKYTDIEETLALQECDAFYDIFVQTEKRLSNCGIVQEPIQERQPILLSVPLRINGAFACELALKYLLIEANIPFNMGTGHNLEYLFSLLPQNKKEDIVSYMKREYSTEPESFHSSLNVIANTFTDQRYTFSKCSVNHSQDSFFNSFVHTVCKYVLEIE